LPVFSHVLILQAGRVVACGRRKTVLTSSVLSGAFQAPIRLQRRDGRYTIQLLQETRGLM
jgi:iron complex transport system ATP-binding protein